MSPTEITIAVTVYDRVEHIRRAIASALDQGVFSGHKVIVVEDCGPNPTLQKSVVEQFGTKVAYHRNPKTRGLFDNWNACIELCKTKWLCILHDDDFLESTFLESMIELADAAPGRGLYYGTCRTVDDAGRTLSEPPGSRTFESTELDIEDWARYDPVCFPGQLFDVAAAREIGGFRAASRYTGDWEMWVKLALMYGSTGTNRIVANYREHHSLGRGTTKVDVSGRKYAYVNMQRKRNYALARRARPALRFDRTVMQNIDPLPTRFIVRHAHSFSDVMTKYNAGLLLRSTPPHGAYRLFQAFAGLFGWRSLRCVSRLIHSFV